MSMEGDAPSNPVVPENRMSCWNDPMRRAVLILLLFAGCASSSQPREQLFAIEVLEQQPVRQRAPLLGPHAYIVRVRNVSEQTITIQAVRLDLVGISEFELQDNQQSLGTILEPGGTTDFNMFVTVVTSGRAVPNYSAIIDSLRVTLACHGDRGNFSESDVYPILPSN
jgi:hypothetical protein